MFKKIKHPLFPNIWLTGVDFELTTNTNEILNADQDHEEPGADYEQDDNNNDEYEKDDELDDHEQYDQIDQEEINELLVDPDEIYPNTESNPVIEEQQPQEGEEGQEAAIELDVIDKVDEENGSDSQLIKRKVLLLRAQVEYPTSGQIGCTHIIKKYRS